MRRKLLAAGVAGLVVTGAAMIAPASASAGVVDRTCTGSASAMAPGS